MKDPFIQSLPDLRKVPQWAMALLAIVAAWFLTTHYLHIYSEVINWDEFAILERAERSLRFGQIIGDGRPGLVSVILMPFVRECIDATRSVVNARIFWQLFTLTYLIGVYYLVRQWFRFCGRRDDGKPQGLLAVALLAFLPAFVVWSVQVRTDQVALAFTTWAGVLLISSKTRHAILSGILFGLGLLCSQKAFYVIGLCGLLFATGVLARVIAGHDTLRGEILAAVKRLAFAAGGAGAAIGCYLLLVPDTASLASEGAVMSSAETMQYSRKFQGYRIYSVHLTRLIVHWVLFVSMLGWSVRVLLKRQRHDYALLATSWSLLAMGAFVILIHGSAFPYFIMTVGLFLALALAMPAASLLNAAGRSGWIVLVMLVTLAAMQSAWEAIENLSDTQAQQRRTLRLIYESPLRERRGFQLEGALLCMRDPNPLPVFFSPGIRSRFFEPPAASENASKFIDEFRSRPVAYIVESYRMKQFPLQIRQFWASHYVWYDESLFLAGFRLEGADAPRTIEVIVHGNYRWDIDSTGATPALRLGGTYIKAGETIELAPGSYEASVTDGKSRGRLILADLPPSVRDGEPAFYHRRQIYQLGGYY